MLFFNKKRTATRRYRPYSFRWRWLMLFIVMIFLGYYVIPLDIQVRSQFEGKKWELPARVYARPLEFYTGKHLSPENLSEELKTLGYQNISPPNKPGQYEYRENDFLITTRGFEFWDIPEPSRTVQVRFLDDKVISINELEQERPLALLRLEPQLIGKFYPTHNEDRILVRLKDVPPALIDALVAMEDRQFYEHRGISIRGLARAVVANFRAGKRVQGGSTLTQQLVKNFFLTSERSFKRKFNEAIMAVLLEWHYSKKEILEVYMNEVYLGQAGKRAIHGMGLAAQFFFNRPLEELKLPEFALLVTLVRGASLYNPRKHPKRAKARRDLVLDVMALNGKISGEEAKRAKEAPLGLEKNTGSMFPAFFELVRRQLRQYYEEKDLDLHSEGLQIVTTLDPVIQKAAEKAMVEGLEKLEGKRSEAEDLQGAMIVVGSQNGEVLAMVNGKATHSVGFNRPLNAKRQIGSLVKPAIYLAALEQSDIYNLTSLVDDTPYQLKTQSGKIWKPKNYGGRSHGHVPLYHALAHSYNLATVHLGMDGLGLDKVTNTLKRLGLDREFEMLPADLLGSIALTPLEVTQIYQTIAGHGFRSPLRAIRDVSTHDGKPLEHHPISVKQCFSAAPVFLLNYALQKAVREGTGRYIARKSLAKDLVLAGKTGTTNNSMDSWFAGFGSDLLTVTWVGRDDNKPMGLTGASGAMVIWSDFINALSPRSEAPLTPDGVEWRRVDSKRFPFIVDQFAANSALNSDCK
ncbi:MAG: penicillin-binding protein 1B [Pseudomonadota bacterium]